MKNIFLVILLALAAIAVGACDKQSPIAPTIVEVPRIYASATASANIFVRCENGTTVSVTVYGFGEAYAITYEEAKRVAEQNAQADLEVAKAKAQASVTVVCGSAPPPPPPPPPPVACTYAVDTTPLTMGYSGENATMSIGTQAGCTWTASVDNSWLEASPLSGVGNNSKIGLYGGFNPGPQRVATVSVRDQNGVMYRKRITQAGRP